MTDIRMHTVQYVAAVLDVSKMTVYRLVETGELLGYRVGRSIRIDSRDLDRYLKEAKIGGAA